MTEIQTLSKKTGIFYDINLLIGYILLSIHYEQQFNYSNNLKIDYQFNDIVKVKDLNKNKYSFINDIFFFELDSEEKCKCKSNFSSTHYMISYNNDNLKELKGQNVNIEILFDRKIKIVCDKCKKCKETKLIFKSKPKILIISFQIKKNEEEKQQFNITFNYNIGLNLKKYCLNNKDNTNYKLICMMKCLEGKNVLATYCKSSTKEDIWYQYKETKEKQKIEVIKINEIQTYKKIPYLLIYQKI